MRRIISILLVLGVMISATTTSFAVNDSEEYYTIPVEYSDNIGKQEQLDVMIQNNNVFVNAKELAERLGYTYSENNEGLVIYNKDTSNGLPFGVTQFKYNSSKVSHMLFNNMIDTYEAPFASIKNRNGSWIPLEYSLLLISSGMMITDDTILIDIPTKNIIDYYYDITKNFAKYNFDWANDFGYAETDIKVLSASSHLVNVFNGLLEFDGASWATLFQQFVGSMTEYDMKYGETLAMLLCTESDKELQATIDKVDMLVDILSEDGTLSQILSNTSTMLDSQVGTLYKNCEDILEKVKNGNSPLVSCNKSYQALEHALDRQTWFSSTGGNILEIQKGVSNVAEKAFTFLDIGLKVAEVVGYTQEFQNQDKFSLVALKYYLNHAKDGLELPKAMRQSMIEYSAALSSSVDKYTTKRFVENVDQWIIDEIPLHEVLGTQATDVLFAWDIAANTIPSIANGLSSSDNLEIALYSIVFQGDAFLNYLSKRNSVFSDTNKITSENLYELTQYCYIYLKACYIAREAALGSLANKSNSTKEKIQPLVDYQNNINSEIAKIMVEFKNANKTNEGYVFGFLPTDNREYLEIHDDSQLIAWLIVSKQVASNADADCAIYTHFLLNGGYDELIGYAFNKDYLEISTCMVDLDFDSTYELLISLTETDFMGIRGYPTTTALLDIQNGTVQVVCSPYYGGGSMGGDYLVFKYDTYTEEHILALDGYMRDGIYAGINYLNIYSSNNLYNDPTSIEQHYLNQSVPYYEEEASNIRNETVLFKSEGDDFYFWRINETFVSESDYKSTISRFTEPVKEAYMLKLGTYDVPICMELSAYETVDMTSERIEVTNYYSFDTYGFAEFFNMRIAEGPGGCNAFGSAEYLYRRGQWANFYSISLHSSTELTSEIGGFQTSIISDKYTIYGAHVGMTFSECLSILEQHGFSMEALESWNVGLSYYHYLYNDEGDRIQLNIYDGTCDGIDLWPNISFVEVRFNVM